jgi:hypothetical protein
MTLMLAWMRDGATSSLWQQAQWQPLEQSLQFGLSCQTCGPQQILLL